MAMSGGHARYPRKVSVNFRKLEEKSLWNYVSLHNIDLEGEKRPSKEELEIICAEHFVEWEVDEDKVVESWISNMTTDRDTRELGAVKKRHRSEFSPYGPYGHGEAPAFGGSRDGGRGNGGVPGGPENVRGEVPVGEQVAAKQFQNNENGSWILAEVVRYLAGRACYEVRDADQSQILEVPADAVIRLREGGQGFSKGDNVLAVFPDTTSFYRAIISKQPVRKAGMVSELVVQFEDDEDETGKTPHRKINSKLVLAQPGRNYYEDYRNNSGHGVYDDQQNSNSPRWGGSDDNPRRGGGGSNGGMGGGYEADPYYGGGSGGGGGGDDGGGGWDDDLARPPKKAKRRNMGAGGGGGGGGNGNGGGGDTSRGSGGSRGGSRGISTGFR